MDYGHQWRHDIWKFASVVWALLGTTLVGIALVETQLLVLAWIRWLSSVRFKYKPGYRSCDLLQIRVPSLVENWFCHKNPLQDLLDSLNSDFLIFKKLKYDNFEQSWLYFWFYCNFEPFQFLKICALLRREHIEISYLIMV